MEEERTPGSTLALRDRNGHEAADSVLAGTGPSAERNQPKRLRDTLAKASRRPPRLTGELRDDALVYTSLGWKLIPVGLNKVPLVQDWPNAATDDADQIMDWLTRWPTANLGVVTGQRSGIYVVDIDQRNDGATQWEELLYVHGEVPTATSHTGGGGFHLFYSAPPFELANSTGRLAPGVDTRGDGGYVVLPPSVHASGEPYEWVQWMRPRELPTWIADAVRRPSAVERTDANDQRASIGEGVRNDTLSRFAGALRNVGADRESIEAALLGINEVAVDPPLGDREVRAIAKSISRYEPAQMRPDLLPSQDEREWIEYSGLDLAALPEPEVKWVLPLIAAKGVVTILTGEWKTAGKTTLLISAVNQTLTGDTFLGEPVRKSPVLYLYEGPADEFNQNDFTYQLHHRDFHLVPQDENSGRGWAEAIEYATNRCLALGAELLVIDTKTAWLGHGGDEENHSGFARQAMNMLAVAKLAGIAIIVAAHPTKNATGSLANMAAGSGQWAASAGRLVGLWAHEDVSDPRRQIEAHGRQGSRNNLPRTIIEWDSVTNAYTVLGALGEIAAEEDETLRLADMDRLLVDFPDGATKADIEQWGQDIGLGRNKTRSLLKKAVKDGKIHEHLGEQPARGPRPKVYARASDETSPLRHSAACLESGEVAEFRSQSADAAVDHGSDADDGEAE